MLFSFKNERRKLKQELKIKAQKEMLTEEVLENLMLCLWRYGVILGLMTEGCILLH